MQKQHSPVIRIVITEVIKEPSPSCREMAYRLDQNEFASRQEALDYMHGIEFIPGTGLKG